MRSIEVTVTDPVGLHARPAALFVKLASQFQSGIQVRNLTSAGNWVNAKSILSLMTAGVRQSDRVEIQADGMDEDTALLALENLVRSDFTISA